MVKIDLTKPSVLEGGFRKVSYPTEMFGLREEMINLLIAKGFIDEPVPLEDLHKHLKSEDMVPDDLDLNLVTKQFYDTSERFREIYFALIKYLGEQYFDYDFIFQEVPTIRFHPPVRFSEIRRSKTGLLLNYHTDSVLGHPLQEINCWLPVTKCYGNSALQVGSLERGIDALSQLSEEFDFDEEVFHTKGREYMVNKMQTDDDYLRFIVDTCQPVKMEYGEVIFFDPRCMHGTAENDENDTRISLDFRLVPLEAYNNFTRAYKSQGRSGRTFTKGDVYFASSAREL